MDERRHGCRHCFTWTGNSAVATVPPDFYTTMCGMCGTWATWRGSWQVGEESAGSRAMAQAERFGDALTGIFLCLGPVAPDPSLGGAAEGMAAEIAEALRIIREVHGV